MSKSGDMTKSEIWMICLTAIMAVGGTIGAPIFYFQLRVMTNQLTQMKSDSAIAEKSLVAVQRAFVAPTVELKPVRDSANKLQFWRVHIALENNGNTQTEKLRWTFTGGVDFAPDPEVSTFTSAYTNSIDNNGSGFLAPKSKNIIIDSIFTRSKMTEVIKGRGAYFVGRCDYEDVFGKSHITKFCVHIYGGPWKAGLPESAVEALIDGVDLGFNMCRRNNCADDECTVEDIGSPTAQLPASPLR